MTTPNPRDQVPDLAEHFQALRLNAFNAPALPLADLAIALDVPVSTIDKLRAQGKGPRCFLIGRRLYVHRDAAREWIDQLAATAAV